MKFRNAARMAAALVLATALAFAGAAVAENGKEIPPAPAVRAAPAHSPSDPIGPAPVVAGSNLPGLNLPLNRPEPVGAAGSARATETGGGDE
jgi:hypothetical protein